MRHGNVIGFRSRLLSFLLASFALISGAATSQVLGTTYSDLWWNPSESGWGVTVNHQQDVMFLTFFVYRADTSPYWVTATLGRVGFSTLAHPPHVFTGDLYETKGPMFSGAFNPSLVTNRKVGTATFTGTLINAATLQYSIDGASVTKSLERQTLRLIDFSGIYLGGTDYLLSNCTIASNNNQEVADTGLMTISQSGTSLRITAQGASSTCTFFGTYGQTGSIGSTTGSFSCSDGTNGTFALDGMQWTLFGMSTRLSGRSQFCNFLGILGGIGVH